MDVTPANALVQLARLGPAGAGVLAGAGLVLFAVGRPGFRPASALVAGGAAAAGLVLAPPPAGFLPVPPGIALATAALLAAVLGLLLPRGGGLLAASVAGLLAGLLLPPLLGLQRELQVVFGGAAGLGAGLILFERMPLFLPPLAGASCVTAGLAAFHGLRGPLILRSPAAWLAVLSVLFVAGVGLEAGREAGRLRREERRHREGRDRQKRAEGEAAMQRWEREGH